MDTDQGKNLLEGHVSIMPSKNTTNKRKADSLNSPLPPKKHGFKTVLTKRGKGMKGMSPDYPAPKAKKVDVAPSPIKLSNKYGLMTDKSEEQIEDASSSSSSSNAKKQRIPPIVVCVSDFAGFRKEILNFLQGIKVSFQIARKGDCRVLPESADDREKLLSYLTEKKHKFYTYDDKSERLFKVVLKGLPSEDKSLDMIKDEIKDLLGFAPAQVIKMKQKSHPGNSRRGISQELYLVHFNKNELNNMQALKKASIMSHVRVSWEHFRRPGGNFQNPTQCRKCQEWGHGTKHCHMDAKCMICGSSHGKDTCPVKEDTNKFKCANCGGNHKSNFWDCPSRKKVMEYRSKQMKGNGHRTPNSAGRVSNNGQAQNFEQSDNVHTDQRTSFVSTGNGVANRPNFNRRNASTYANVTAGRQNASSTHRPTENYRQATDSGSMSASDFDFLSEQLHHMIDAMFKANTMAEAVQVGVKFTNKIVIGLRFSNGSK